MKEIALTQGLVAIVDDADYERLLSYKWFAWASDRSDRNYAATKRKGVLLMHRVVMQASPGQFVDHINGDGLDNRKSNLRFVTNSQNAQNRRLQSTKNTSGYKGVSFRKRTGRWEASIKLNQKQKWLGSFTSPLAAARSYDEAAKQLFGDYGRLNFAVGS